MNDSIDPNTETNQEINWKIAGMIYNFVTDFPAGHLTAEIKENEIIFRSTAKLHPNKIMRSIGLYRIGMSVNFSLAEKND